MTFLASNPCKPSRRSVPFVLFGRKERRRRSHAVPNPRSLNVGQPLCKRRTRAAAFLGRRVKHDHVFTCVQEVAKVMTTSTDQQIGLKQAKFELGLCVQPWNRGGSHGPSVDVKADEEHQLGRAAEGIVGGCLLYTSPSPRDS